MPDSTPIAWFQPVSGRREQPPIHELPRKGPTLGSSAIFVP
jgi:hypothetical protein